MQNKQKSKAKGEKFPKIYTGHSNKCLGRYQASFTKRPSQCRCDGYHTFKELYAHRIALYIALVESIDFFNKRAVAQGAPLYTIPVWRSKVHSDGSNYPGWFIVGIHKSPGRQITYHLPNKFWDQLEWMETLHKAPEFDNHNSDDVIKRLGDL